MLKIGILTSKNGWFEPYAKELLNKINDRFRVDLFFNHKKIPAGYDVIFILSYFKIIEDWFLNQHEHNLVVHESALPKGRGWAPLFWQILEGKRVIPVSLFEADRKMDAGPLYLKDTIRLKGHEIHDEIRQLQALATKRLCINFLDRYSHIKPRKQKGRPSYYRRRRPQDSRLDISKTIKQQFNLIRIADNSRYPAFFYYRRHKYLLKVYKEGK